MIVSRGRRAIFVHIPKTGGTSFAAAYEARALKDDILIGDTPKARARRRRLAALRPAGRLWKHSMLRDIAGVVTEAEMDDFFVFTLVRNPWDRLVSYYHWLKSQRFDHPAVRLAQARDFAGFAGDDATLAALAAGAEDHVRTPAGRMVCDAFVRLENLEADLAPVGRRLGVRLDRLPRLNRSDRPADHRPLYTDALAELVGRAAARDVARFGYRFDDPPVCQG